jgi:hypothetical protein
LRGSRISAGWSRYEYSLDNFTGMVHLACPLILLRQL